MTKQELYEMSQFMYDSAITYDKLVKYCNTIKYEKSSERRQQLAQTAELNMIVIMQCTSRHYFTIGPLID